MAGKCRSMELIYAKIAKKLKEPGQYLRIKRKILATDSEMSVLLEIIRNEERSQLEEVLQDY